MFCAMPGVAWVYRSGTVGWLPPVTHSHRLPVHGGRKLPVPCGSCAACAQSEAAVWCLRFFDQLAQGLRCWVLELPYADSVEGGDMHQHVGELVRALPAVVGRYRACTVGQLDPAGFARRCRVLLAFDGLGKSQRIAAGVRAVEPVLSAKLRGLWPHGRARIVVAGEASILSICGYVEDDASGDVLFRKHSAAWMFGHSWLQRYGARIVQRGRVDVGGASLCLFRTYLLRPEFIEDLEWLRRNGASLPKAAEAVQGEPGRA